MKKTTLLLAFFLALGLQGFAQFSESFENGIPSNWTVINGGDENTWMASPPPFTPAHTGNNVARINFSQQPHHDFLITKQFTVVAGVTDRLTLWARNLSLFTPESFDILVSVTGTLDSDFTYTIASSVTPADDYWEKLTYSLDNYIGEDIYIAFYSNTTDKNQLYIDDVTVDTVPTTVPGCITNPVSVINPACGNYATSISWDTVPNIDGYYLSIGTTSGGTDVVDNQDIGLSTTYIVEGQAVNTTYYWKVVPYNTIGTATGCTINQYTTSTSTCYCAPNPVTVADFGITNVSIGEINNETLNEPGNYGDYSSQITNVYQGLTMPFSITYQTSGFDYETKIWIDWNDDFDFDDAGEEVYSGASEFSSPAVLTGSFVVPATASIGMHRMRIGGQDNGPVLTCYDGFDGTFEDYTVKVGVANCTPPAAIVTDINFDCQNDQFFIGLNVVNMGSGAPSLTDNDMVWPITANGNIEIGPFGFGSPVTLLLQHGGDSTCNVPLGTITIAGCPPVNDNCANAIPLAVGTNYSSGINNGNNRFATSSIETSPQCGGYAGGDVWYSVVVPPSGNVTIQTGQTSTGDALLFDTVISIYSGSCGSLVPVDCDDDSAGVDLYSLKSLTDQVPGSTLYIRVFEYSNDNIGEFGIAAYEVPLGNTPFERPEIAIYPNPVKDILNLSSESVISNIAVFNLLGQKVFEKYVYGTQLQVDLSSLANGTYLVKIGGSDSVKTMRIIKSN